MSVHASNGDRGADSPASSLNRPTHVRVSISQVMIWTAATAFVLAVFPRDWLRSALPLGGLPSSELRDWLQDFEKFSIVAVAPVYGAAVASLAVAGWRLVQRRQDFPTQPGHWLLVQTGLGILAASCFVATDNDLFQYSNAELHAVRRRYGPIVLGLLAGLCAAGVLACRKNREPRRWRWQLRCQAVALTMPLAAFLLATTDPAPTSPHVLARLTIGCWAAAAIAGLVAAAGDLWQRARYDLTHYAGAIVPAVMLLHPVVTKWLAEWLM